MMSYYLLMEKTLFKLLLHEWYGKPFFFLLNIKHTHKGVSWCLENGKDSQT